MALEKLGPYRLQKVLGRGGMGAVYAGLNEATGERAAVKVLSGHLADDGAFRERFQQEVETLKRLLHPNIVQLFGFGEEDGHLFYVMELVEGRSLQDELIAGRRFNWREAARIGVAVASALKHAHDRGIIHRDLKPANLLLDGQDHVKLADFGIAKLYGGANVTADGGVLGTADYMAPEQAEGKQVTSRCDLYALGSVLYALLAGRPPFAGKTIVEVITALKSETPIPIRRLAPDTPQEFEEIIAQLLEKDPHQRIPTAMALANRLMAMEHALSLETRVHKPLTSLLPAADKPPASSALTAVRPDPAATVPLPDNEDQDYRIAGVPTALTGSPAAASSAPPTHIPHEADALELAPEEPAAKKTEFTRVSETDLRRNLTTGDDSESNLKQWLLVGSVLAVGVALLGGVLYFATRPPSADQLYETVHSAAEKGGVEELLSVEADLTRFLAAHPNDPRAAELVAYREDLDLYRLQKRFELRARRVGGVESLTPVERGYLEAVQLATTDPEAALARFEALVNVFGGPADPNLSALENRTSEQCLTLARQQVAKLQTAVQKMNLQQRMAVRRELERAGKLAASDRAAAEKVWQGIVTLYADKSWAKDLVEQARSELAKRE